MSVTRNLLAAGFLSTSVLSWTASACSGPRGQPGDAGADGIGSDAPAGDAAAPPSCDDGGVCLTALSVTTAEPDSGAYIFLTPAFAPHIRDYYVTCPEYEGNEITVSMTASPGADSELLGPMTSPKTPSQTRTITVSANQAIVAAATNGKMTSEYWVRCLPPDFPALSWTPHPEAGTPTPGYYAIGWWFAPSGGAGYGMLLDSNGVPVWYVRPPERAGATDLDNVILSPPTLTYFNFSGPPVGPFEAIQVNPHKTFQIAPSKTPELPTLHELQVMPNGHYLGLANPLIGGVDLTGLSVVADGGLMPLGPNETIEDCLIVEFDSSGKTFWKWSATAHFEPAKVGTHASVAFDGKKADAGMLIDTYHCNSIDIDPTSPDKARPNLLVSARDMDSVFYVDGPSGKVVWKMGGARESLDDAVYVKPQAAFYQQHDARFLASWQSTCNGGAGEVSLFDDETPIIGAKARALVFRLAVGGGDGGPGDAACPGATDGGLIEAGDAGALDGSEAKDAGASGEAGEAGKTEGGKGGEGGAPDAGEPTTTGTLVWEYQGSAGSLLAGSFRILPDGSRIIGWGANYAPYVVFTEVDEKKNKLLEMGFPLNGKSYRAIKLPLNRFDINDLRKTAGLAGPP